MTSSVQTLASLPDVETRVVLRASVEAHRALAELKGLALTIPNQQMLLSTLSLQEAKASSAVENIITTHDELYQSNYQNSVFTSGNAKEVHNYVQAMRVGFDAVQQTGLLTGNTIVQIQQTLEENQAGFRAQMGTQLKNERTGEVVYTPPQEADEIVRLMTDLERFINEPAYGGFDDLVKMAIIHHQFESIHPFYDGNGRTGRIVNVLYLVKQDLLTTPILYLSRYINDHKSDYYRLLQQVRTTGEWESWLLFMLQGVAITSRQTQNLIVEIKNLMGFFKRTIRQHQAKIYSHELINNLFSYPYTKTDFLIRDLGVHRNTAAKYLKQLTDIGLLEKQKAGKENFFINHQLFALLQNAYQAGDTV